jgi:pimeloyl-ACP methyl ester carboxylesterase
MGLVECNGVTINCRSMGAGSDVVLIHGLAANQAFWQLNVLLTLARRHRVTIYDLRGHGYSGMPPSGYNSAEMAEDLHHLLQHLNISRVDLVGHSFGGVVALNYAVYHPERVASLTIADSRVRAFQPVQQTSEWLNRETALKKLKELGFDIPEKETEVGFWLLEELAAPKWQNERQKLQGSDLFVPFGGWNGGQRTADRWLELLRTTTARQEFTSLVGLTPAELATIQQPTLAIYGANSPVLPSLQGLEKTLPNSKSVIVPEAGHFFPLTQPKLFVDMVSRFLKETGPNERRSARFALKVPVGLRVNGTAYPGSTINVSQRGLLIESYLMLEVGSKVEVIVTPDETTPIISALGNVVRRVKGEADRMFRYGIEFIPPEPWMADADTWNPTPTPGKVWDFLKEQGQSPLP